MLRKETREQYLQRFADKWYGEALGEYNTPGSRLIDRLHHDCKKENKHTWYPWKCFMSEWQEEQERKNWPKAASISENASMRQRYLDYQAGILELSGADKHGADDIRRKFELRAKLHAIVLGAHLGVHRAFDNKVMRYYTGEALEGKYGFRPCSFAELLAGDKYIWNQMWKLVNSGSWSINEVILEFTIGRSTVDGILGCHKHGDPRPGNGGASDGDGARDGGRRGNRPNKRKRGGDQGGQPAPKQHRRDRGGRDGDRGSKGKGKENGKGKSKGKDGKSGKDNKRRSDYPTFLCFKIDGKAVCQKRHIKGLGCSNNNCPRTHRCPVRKTNGSPCGGDHKVENCPLQQSERKDGVMY